MIGLSGSASGPSHDVPPLGGAEVPPNSIAVYPPGGGASSNSDAPQQVSARSAPRNPGEAPELMARSSAAGVVPLAPMQVVMPDYDALLEDLEKKERVLDEQRQQVEQLRQQRRVYRDDEVRKMQEINGEISAHNEHMDQQPHPVPDTVTVQMAGRSMELAYRFRDVRYQIRKLDDAIEQFDEEINDIEHELGLLAQQRGFLRASRQYRPEVSLDELLQGLSASSRFLS